MNTEPYDFIIIGGGIHGTSLAYQLERDNKVAVIDPKSRLLSQWKRNTKNCGQTHLRSPYQHNIGRNGDSLFEYAIEEGRLSEIETLSGIERPTLNLFNDHCDEIIYRNNLNDLLINGHVRFVLRGKKRLGEKILVITDETSVETKNVVFAVGHIGGQNWPQWAAKHRGSDSFYHVFDENFDIDVISGQKKPIYVVGGGITAAQLAIKLSENLDGSYPITMISKKPLEVSELDARSLWTDLNYVSHMLWDENPNDRERIVFEARNSGTLPAHVYGNLIEVSKSGAIKIKVDSITDVEGYNYDKLTIRSLLGEKYPPNSIFVLSTGFNEPKGNRLLYQVSRAFGLPLSPSGYPILHNNMRWGDYKHGNFYVSGELGALTLGPLAGNIRGAQMVSELMEI